MPMEKLDKDLQKRVWQRVQGDGAKQMPPLRQESRIRLMGESGLWRTRRSRLGSSPAELASKASCASRSGLWTR